MVETNKIFEQLNNPVLYLILSNLLILVFALVYDWNTGEIIWTFLIQNIIIGFFNVVRILKTQTFKPATGENAAFQNPIAAKTVVVFVKLFLAGFFVVHYGGFQLGYMILLLAIFKNVSASTVLLSGLIFLIPHYISYKQKSKYDKEDGIKLIKLMFLPYLRVIPMDIIIFIAVLIGPENKITLTIFLILKTIVDVKMHLVERKLNEHPSISFDDVVRNAARKSRTTRKN